MRYNTPNPKWAYSFLLLLLTVGWAYLALHKLEIALVKKIEVDILVSSVISVLLGGLMTWNAIVIQHWFRKAGPNDKPPPGRPLSNG